MTSVVKLIQDFNKDRNPFFLAMKYEEMTASAFKFFRGSCHLFYRHLLKDKNFDFEDPTRIWICGDLHLENYGSYKGSDGVVYYDIGR